jgi:hypothetical protein
MQLKSTLQTLGRIFFWSISLSLPLSTAGCSQTACFTWSKVEGECPSQKKALPFFQDPRCPSSIVAVDSDGDYSNNLCCYTVTKEDTDPDDASFLCEGFPSDAEGVGGFSGTGGVGGSGVTPPPDAPSCLRCGQALANSLFLEAPVCSKSRALLDAVNACICESGACANSCEATLCAHREADSACLSCLSNTATGCGAQFDACASDS